MLQISRLMIEDSLDELILDEPHPHFSFSLSSDREGESFASGKIVFENGYELALPGECGARYQGPALKPFSTYRGTLHVTSSFHEEAVKEFVFHTGRMNTPWVGRFITDGSYSFTEKKVSPTPMVFKKTFQGKANLESAKIYATAIGIYELELNGKKVGDRYFAPGFTSYAHDLYYQVYDIAPLLKDGENTLIIHLAGGWAVGSYVFSRVNRVTADRQSLLLEIRMEEGGKTTIIGSDQSFLVSREGPYKMVDLYDGETFDASVDLNNISFHPAALEEVKIKPRILADIGEKVMDLKEMTPVSKNVLPDGSAVYDFGQNFAGVVDAEIHHAEKGQTIVFTHGEILTKDGLPNVKLLRSAKATATYICKEGNQHYRPKMAYMGFRYLRMSGIDPEQVEIKAYARYSKIEQTGDFLCSDERINRLQKNILWSSYSNFVDIPTDCPQRDERMGWTGDIALFAKTACWNFAISRFFKRWLKDLRSEQLKTGGIPNTIPNQGFGFPVTMPKMAIDFWGDACALVPFALYEHYGDEEIIHTSYDSMKRYCLAEKFWANIWGVGKYRYIWHTPALFHFGDWVSPDEPTMAGWQKRSKYTATASLYNMARHVEASAKLLGKEEDAAKFKIIAEKTASSYRSVFMDRDYRIRGKEFQTAYVLPLHFKMLDEEGLEKGVSHLAELVKKGNYSIATGFPGTPYILFALADNGHVEDAYKMLLTDICPSWLYEVKKGATTIWERFDAIADSGEGNLGQDDGTGGMVSFNHYASGAVGNFLYSRVLGIQEV
ncbi:MAG: family 78 glycoside hydrolase catalytic domain, partial [Bacilli bacterium]|nr:family 78 glycoside hydrolase catalytic domain [Bacilli bacterium]